MQKRLNEWMLPITIVAFMGPNVMYLSAVLSTSVRWFFIIALGVHVVSRKVKKKVPFMLLIVLYLYTLWCFMTVFWSEQFFLSILKAISASVIIFTCLFAGQTWVVSKTDKSQALNYLGLLSIITLAMTVLGYLFNPNAFSDYDMFQGYTYNPNVFGGLAAYSCVFFLWKAYLKRSSTKGFRLWLAINSVNFIALIMSQSRSSLILALCILLSLFFALSKRILLTALYSVAFLTLASFLFFADIKDEVIKRLIYKNTPSDVSDSLFFSREIVWADSLDAAHEGGWFGGGYGVAIGAKEWEGGFTANTYGREKGNSQLAVLEEIGVVGFALYLGIILIILKQLHAGYKAAKSKDIKVAMALVSGTIVGMLVQSIFEGWWVALGSIDGVVFWTTTGVGLGLKSLAIRQSNSALCKS